MILDSNIVLHLLDEPPGTPLFEAIAATRGNGPAFVNEIIFAEVASRFRSLELLEGACDALGLTIEPLTLAECHRAGVVFAEYRRRGGTRHVILPDFLIGAQAEMRGWPLVTRDRKGFASYFPDITIIDPLEDVQ